MRGMGYLPISTTLFTETHGHGAHLRQLRDMNCAYPERAALEHFSELLSPGAYDGNDYAQALLDCAASSLGNRILSLPAGQGLIVR